MADVSEAEILNAFKRYRSGEKADGHMARVWMVPDPVTGEWVGAKQIWALCLGIRCSETNSAAARRGLRAFNPAPVGPHGPQHWESYSNDVSDGNIDPPAGVEKPSRCERTVTVTSRDPAVAVYTRARANGRCEACAAPAPFKGKDGYPFLEVHHIRHLREDGADTPNNTVALCPNCHRRAHHASDAAIFTQKLKRIRC